jgi:hypothetical protein
METELAKAPDGQRLDLPCCVAADDHADGIGSHDSGQQGDPRLAGLAARAARTKTA